MAAESNQDSPVRGRAGRGRRGGGGAGGRAKKKEEEQHVAEASEEDNSDLDISDVDEEGKLDVSIALRQQYRLVYNTVGSYFIGSYIYRKRGSCCIQLPVPTNSML